MCMSEVDHTSKPHSFYSIYPTSTQKNHWNNMNNEIIQQRILKSVVEISQGSPTTDLIFQHYLTDERLRDDVGRSGDVSFNHVTNQISIREQSAWTNIEVFRLCIGYYRHPSIPSHILGFRSDSTPFWYKEDDWTPQKFETIKDIVIGYRNRVDRKLSEPEPEPEQPCSKLN